MYLDTVDSARSKPVTYDVAFALANEVEGRQEEKCFKLGST